MARQKVYPLGSNPEIDKPLMLNVKHVEEGLRDGSLWRRTDGIVFAVPRKTTPDQRLWTRDSGFNYEVPNGRTPLLESDGRCEICGFDRFVELCHIVPARFGGPAVSSNILKLCPNHHRLFDRNLLSSDEILKVWPRISAALKARPDEMLTDWRNALCSTYGLTVEAA